MGHEDLKVFRKHKKKASGIGLEFYEKWGAVQSVPEFSLSEWEQKCYRVCAIVKSGHTFNKTFRTALKIFEFENKREYSIRLKNTALFDSRLMQFGFGANRVINVNTLKIDKNRFGSSDIKISKKKAYDLFTNCHVYYNLEGGDEDWPHDKDF